MESTSGLSRNKGRMSLNSTWSLDLPENPAEWYSISSRCQGEAMDVASCAAAHEVRLWDTSPARQSTRCGREIVADNVVIAALVRDWFCRRPIPVSSGAPE